jgi:hypothetical protein
MSDFIKTVDFTDILRSVKESNLYGAVWYTDLISGNLNRTDGPAIEWADGHKEWWIDGKRHRTDEPAIEYPDGTFKWFLDGVEFTKIQWLDELKEDL